MSNEDNNHPKQNGKEKPVNGHKIILTSDNWTGAHHSISEALLRHSAGCDKAYGAGDLDKKIERTFNQIFEREVAVYFVGTGWKEFYLKIFIVLTNCSCNTSFFTERFF